jgi:hypothetical protein
MLSPASEDYSSESLASSCWHVEYRSQPTSDADSWSDALGQRLKELFSKEVLVLSMKVAKDND